MNETMGIIIGVMIYTYTGFLKAQFLRGIRRQSDQSQQN